MRTSEQKYERLRSRVALSTILGAVLLIIGFNGFVRLHYSPAFAVLAIVGSLLIGIPGRYLSEENLRREGEERERSRRKALGSTSELKPKEKQRQYRQYSDEELDNKVKQYLRWNPHASGATIADRLNIELDDLADALIRLRKKE